MRRKPGLPPTLAALAMLCVVLWIGAGALARSGPPADATAASAPFDGFVDVPSGAPYEPAITALHEAGVIDGYVVAGTRFFRPRDPMMRAQFAKMICGALAVPVSEDLAPPFVDLGADDPANLYPHDYIAAVAALGISRGTGPGVFSPWRRVTRTQVITMTVRAAEAVAPGTLTAPAPGFTGTLGAFDPAHSETLRTAEWNGLLTGLVGFGPDWDPWADAARGEAAEMLARLMASVGSGPEDVTTTTTVPPKDGQPVGSNVPITFRLFPADNPWNTDISGYPVHPSSGAFIAAIGTNGHLHPDFGTVWNGAPNGIPYVVVPGDQPLVPVAFHYEDESDPGPYPIPADAPIEGGPDGDGDRHVLILDAAHGTLYELFDARAAGDHWTAGSGAVFDLTSNALRPEGWTSADAAGLPILPGLVRYDEVAAGEITHALRFTVSRTQRAYIHPATHYASSDTDPALPPMGLRLRLRADFDVSGFPPRVQVILRALKTYGMMVADNGADWYISGAPDPRWDDDELRTLRRVPGSAFEAVYTGPVVGP